MLWDERERINIGKFCSIADEVTIFGGGEHRIDWVTTFPLRIAFGLEGAWRDGIPATKGKTEIGNDVWIGYGATILSGVRVGDGAVIGAHALVAGDIPPYAVVGGNPARVLKLRFQQAVISRLLDIRWWDWPIHEVRAVTDLLCSPNMADFLNYAETRLDH